MLPVRAVAFSWLEVYAFLLSSACAAGTSFASPESVVPFRSRERRWNWNQQSYWKMPHPLEQREFLSVSQARRLTACGPPLTAADLDLPVEYQTEPDLSDYPAVLMQYSPAGEVLPCCHWGEPTDDTPTARGYLQRLPHHLGHRP